MGSLKMCFFACCSRYGNSNLAFAMVLVQFWPVDICGLRLLVLVIFQALQHPSFAPF